MARNKGKVTRSKRGHNRGWRQDSSVNPIPEPTPLANTSGEITWPKGAIPSVTDGKSPAMDFTNALMSGNPFAEHLAEQALRQRPKRETEPSLADIFVAETYTICKRLGVSAHTTKLIEPILMTYRHDIRNAHRFVLDPDFVRYITEISSTIPAEKLLARVQYATLPYDTVWIEFPLRVKVEVMRTIHHMDPTKFNWDEVADRLGLILRRVDDTAMTVEMVCETFGNHGLIGTTICYFFSVDERDWRSTSRHHGCKPVLMPEDVMRAVQEREVSDEVKEELLKNDRLHELGGGSLWGYMKEGKGKMIEKAHQVRDIVLPTYLSRHGCLGTGRMKEILQTFIVGKEKTTELAVLETISELMMQETIEFTGMMRWVVCVLAALNMVPISTRHVENKGKTIRYGLTNRKPLMDHHVVTLRVPKTKPVQWIEKQFRLAHRNRAHWVMAHWRTYEYEHDNCVGREHEWQMDYELGFGVCSNCTAYRRYIREHTRGDPNLGWVQKSYVVKPEKQS